MKRLLVFAFLLLPGVTAMAAEEADPLEEVLVSGEQPGPGLWQVHHGENTLWILGNYDPLPKKMKWRSKQVEELVAESQAVIAEPDVDADIGFFSAVGLIPSILRARKLPEGKTLENILPPELYARWNRQKQLYLKGNDSVDKWRPVFAAGMLQSPAMDAAQLSSRDIVWPIVEKAAKHAKVPIRQPELRVEFEDPKGLIQEFTKSSPEAEVACFDSLVTRVERDLPLLQQRANAWAVGDVSVLRDRPPDAPDTRCMPIISGSPKLAAKVEEVITRVRQEWLLAVEGALLRNKSTVAVVPIRELLVEDGLLARLKALGYRVDEPE